VGIRQVQIPLNRNKTEFNSSDAVAGREGLVSKRRTDECPPEAERWLMENDGWNSMKVRERIIAVTGRGKLGKWSSIAQQAQPEQTDWIQLIRRVAGQYDQQ
jgi:hypothetical protein